MPARIPNHKRAKILASIRAGEETCRGIARDHHVSDTLVRKIAKEAGVPVPWSREQTKAATAAKTADNAARRANLATRLLHLSEKALDQAEAELDQASALQAATIAGIAVDKHLAVVRHDADPGVETGKSMLIALAAAVGVAHQQLQPSEAGDGV
jgi:hypothetical protein